MLFLAVLELDVVLCSSDVTEALHACADEITRAYYMMTN